MSENTNKVEFKIEDTGEKVQFYVIEQVTINNATYLLVTEDNEAFDELEAYILKEKNIDGEEVLYEIVENEEELTFIYKVFAEKIDEYDLDL